MRITEREDLQIYDPLICFTRTEQHARARTNCFPESEGNRRIFRGIFESLFNEYATSLNLSAFPRLITC